MENEVFKINARRCKRCGGLLTSPEALKEGYGHTCRMKVRREQLGREELRDQISLFDGGEEDESAQN